MNLAAGIVVSIGAISAILIVWYAVGILFLNRGGDDRWVNFDDFWEEVRKEEEAKRAAASREEIEYDRSIDI